MAVVRHENERKFKLFDLNYDKKQTTSTEEFGGRHEEWGHGDDRINEEAWQGRYEWEAAILLSIIEDKQITKILEIGSGPGKLADIIQKKSNRPLNFTLIDKPLAKESHIKNKFKADKFLVKDLNNSFDVSDLDKDYDLVIANDFMEHIANPSDCLINCYNVVTDNAYLFVSVPNWRMGHEFIYRGLFDFDNWTYFMGTHGWDPKRIFPSHMECQGCKDDNGELIAQASRLNSESILPESMLLSWNFYFLGQKVPKGKIAEAIQLKDLGVNHSKENKIEELKLNLPKLKKL